jgi:hypothetical protein
MAALILRFDYVIPSDYGEFETFKSSFATPVVGGLSQVPEAASLETQRWKRQKKAYMVVPRRPRTWMRNFDRMVMECLQLIHQEDGVDEPDFESIRERFSEMHLQVVNFNIRKRYQWLYKTVRLPPRVYVRDPDNRIVSVPTSP